MTIYTKDFPHLETNRDFTEFFREELVFFYFHNSRLQKYGDIISFSNRFDNVLSTIKTQMMVNRNATLPYLSLFYRLIANNRDIQGGKGEQNSTYVMIWKLYGYFPSLAIFLLHRFVKPTQNQEYTFGSWRDIKYLCDFIKQHSRYHENDSFIETCIEIANTQLNYDINTWKCSEHAMDKRYVSNVAKWIPREYKKMGWLFDKLSQHWGKTYYPYIMNSANTHTSKMRAESKYKQLYRKNVSYMNKAIDTTEIKLCKKQRSLIEPTHIPLCCVSKHKNVVYYDSDDNDKLECSANIQKHLEYKYSNPTTNLLSPECYNSSSSLPISYYVKEAISFLENDDGNENAHYHILNNQWQLLSNTHSHHFSGDVIPVIDVTSSMQKYDDDPLFAAIGYAILISQHSSIQNRILAVDNNPTWIQLEPDMTFIHKVKQILEYISSGYSTKSSYTRAFNLIGKTFLQTQMTGEDIQNMRFVIFSTFNEKLNVPMYDTLNAVLGTYSKNMPHITFWNLSKHDISNLPCNYNQPNVQLLSGYSPHLISNLQLNRALIPYLQIKNILDEPQYQVLDDYINRIVKDLPNYHLPTSSNKHVSISEICLDICNV